VTLFRGGNEMALEIKPQLSSTAEWTVSPMSTLLLNNGVAPNQPWVARFNLNTLQGDTLEVWQPVRWQTGDNLRDVILANPGVGTLTPAASGAANPAAVQIAQLKRQVDEMQKSLTALEATLQTSPAEQPSKRHQKTQEQPTDKPQQ
jgi:hypothetical protein